jgi:hypothetical protein
MVIAVDEVSAASFTAAAVSGRAAAGSAGPNDATTIVADKTRPDNPRLRTGPSLTLTGELDRGDLPTAYRGPADSNLK